jgi:hypothetical protein
MPGISNIGGPAGGAGGQFQLDLLVVELAVAQLPAEAVAGRLAGGGPDQGVEDPVLGGRLGLGLHGLPLHLPGQADRHLHEVAHDLLHVAADIADLGELGRLDLQERGVGEPGQAPGDLGLAAAGRPDHQDVLGRHLLAERAGELLAAPAVA